MEDAAMFKIDALAAAHKAAALVVALLVFLPIVFALVLNGAQVRA
jgi:hypothetical protein